MKMQGTNKFKNLIEVNDYFRDEDICRKYLANLRWNENPICPHCGYDKAYEYQNGKLYKCAKCRQQFTVKVGTIFEDSKIPLKKWFTTVYLLTSHKKGISSLQLSRDIGVTQKTAWFMLHRIRYAIRTKSFNKPLGNIVEVDEMYVGGKEENKHQSQKHAGRNNSNKSTVLGMIERHGKVIAQAIPAPKKEFLFPLIKSTIKEGSTVVTDNYTPYTDLRLDFDHETVSHTTGEYVRGIYHTNSIENFWSLFKRGFVGTYHNMSEKHLDKYLDEFEFRFNSRKIGEVERFDVFLQEIQGRLKYQQLIT
jgi:transposase-like protein